MAKTWNKDRAAAHINKKIEEVSDVNIKDYGRDKSLSNIAVNEAYRVDGVHVYADILNLDEMLNVTGIEGEQCHKRTLRFLDLHYRAVTRVLDRVDAKRVDFQNQRLHSVFVKPYNSEADAEKKRLQRAVATAQLIIDVLKETGDEEERLPAAKVRIGVDTGCALAVNNGRRGSREPLFLGDPANHAAKIAGKGKATGIFLTNSARKVLGLESLDKPEHSALTNETIAACQEAAALDVTAEAIVKEWKADLKNKPIGNFVFTGHTPPLCTLDISALTPGNSRRQDAVSVYADISGFTDYVGEHIDHATEDVVRVLHVVRAELERVLHVEFEGRRIRFIGDCMHGLLCEGTAQTTEAEKTVTNATLLSGALRSSFNLALERLSDKGYATGDLGLAIGFEYGPMTVTRLGMQGDRIRCSVSRGVLESESRQRDCYGHETAIGPAALKVASEAVRALFGRDGKARDLDYNEAVEQLADAGDATAKSARNAAFGGAPAIVRAVEQPIRPHCQDTGR